VLCPEGFLYMFPFPSVTLRRPISFEAYFMKRKHRIRWFLFCQYSSQITQLFFVGIHSIFCCFMSQVKDLLCRRIEKKSLLGNFYLHNSLHYQIKASRLMVDCFLWMPKYYKKIWAHILFRESVTKGFLPPYHRG